MWFYHEDGKAFTFFLLNWWGFQIVPLQNDVPASPLVTPDKQMEHTAMCAQKNSELAAKSESSPNTSSTTNTEKMHTKIL